MRRRQIALGFGILWVCGGSFGKKDERFATIGQRACHVTRLRLHFGFHLVFVIHIALCRSVIHVGGGEAGQ